MKTRYHLQITREALAPLFNESALRQIIRANLWQDNPRGQFGHPEYHFDDNAFAQGSAYLERNRREVLAYLVKGRAGDARKAFGRLTHAAQDIYAHSNYVKLWLAKFPKRDQPVPGEIDALDEEILSSPHLSSGRITFPEQLGMFLPFAKRWLHRLTPADSHAAMNLDSPARGPLFPFAVQAALKRTRAEFDRTVQGMTDAQVRSFTGRS